MALKYCCAFSYPFRVVVSKIVRVRDFMTDGRRYEQKFQRRRERELFIFSEGERRTAPASAAPAPLALQRRASHSEPID